jgi:hypothetical protein
VSYQPARAAQIEFLGDLMRQAGYATEAEIAEYQEHLAFAGQHEDPGASEGHVAELIDHALDQLDHHLWVQPLTEEIREEEWKLTGEPVPPGEGSVAL